MNNTSRKIKIKEVIKHLNTGLDAIRRAPIVVEETGFKCLRIQDISQNKDINKWGNTKISPKDFEQHRIQAGDIIMARTCSTGIHYFAKENLNAVYNNGLARIRFEEDVLPEFAHYMFLTREFTGYIRGVSGGTSVQQNMQLSDILNYEFSLPPLHEQHRISNILSSFDNKIELLRKENNTLENIAQSIFKEWFVKYNFPNKDGKPYRDNNGKMIDSELGLIPEGWRVGKLGEIVNCFDSKRIPLSNEERSQKKGLFPYYGATEIMDYIDSYIFDGKYLLLAEDGSVQTEKGTPILQLINGQFWVNNHTHVLQGKDPFTTEYIYLLMKDFNITNIITGAVQPKINQQNLLNLQIVIPSSVIMQSRMEYFTKIYKKITTNEIFLSNIQKIRNLQLQKLIHS